MTQLETWKDLIDRKRFALIRMAYKGKNPIEKGWQNLVYRPLEYIGFGHRENAGIITGETSGVLVLDIDNPRLFEEFSKREALNVPETFTVRTAKGTHHYYQYPQDGCRYGNKAYGNRYGFDIRGDGGCIVAPGSVHPDGKVYVIELNTEIAEAPKWLADMARETKSPIDKSSPNQKERCTKATNRSQMDTLDSLSLPPTLEQTILEDAQIGKRSETIWFVLNGLKELGVSNEIILSIFEQYPIGQRTPLGGPVISPRLSSSPSYYQQQGRLFSAYDSHHVACLLPAQLKGNTLAGTYLSFSLLQTELRHVFYAQDACSLFHRMLVPSQGNVSSLPRPQ